MCISDWSADVCSSDLLSAFAARVRVTVLPAPSPTTISLPSIDSTVTVSVPSPLSVRLSPTALPKATAAMASEPGVKPMVPSAGVERSEEHTSELQSLMRISYAVFCLKKKKTTQRHNKASTNKPIRQINNKENPEKDMRIS